MLTPARSIGALLTLAAVLALPWVDPGRVLAVLWALGVVVAGAWWMASRKPSADAPQGAGLYPTTGPTRPRPTRPPPPNHYRRDR